jgi:hypothetical protein
MAGGFQSDGRLISATKRIALGLRHFVVLPERRGRVAVRERLARGGVGATGLLPAEPAGH